eukprot:Skav216783  [mRNA]  locus=scaffold579:171669:177675:+ [translate_table: standard]
MQAPNGGWWCPKHACGAANGMNANYCNQCGTHWQWTPKQKKPPKRNQNRQDPHHGAEWWEQPWEPTTPKAAEDKGKSPAKPRRPSRRQREKAKKEKEAKEASGDGVVKPSPFTSYAPNSFQAPASSSTPFMQSPVNPQAAAVNQELVSALRAAYPDSATVPDSVKDLLDRAKDDATKVLTKSLHQATAALGRAKKLHAELLEVRRIHRTNWLKHLTASTVQWRQQLEDYRKQQMSYQESINRASKEVSVARRQILQLNLSEAGVEMPVLGDDTEPAAEITQDKEEDILRQELQHTLQACAESVGPLNIDAAQLKDIEDMESDEERRKRSRSEASAVPAPVSAPDCHAPKKVCFKAEVIEAYHAGLSMHDAACPYRRCGWTTEYAGFVHVHSVNFDASFKSLWDAQNDAACLHWQLEQFSEQFQPSRGVSSTPAVMCAPLSCVAVSSSGSPVCAQAKVEMLLHDDVHGKMDDANMSTPPSPVYPLPSANPAPSLKLDSISFGSRNFVDGFHASLHSNGEVLSLMQNSIAVRQDPRVDVALYRRGRTMIHARAARHPVPDCFVSVARALNLSPHDIGEVFEVYRPLPGLVASRMPWLVLTHDDPFDQSLDAFVLCDVLLYDAAPAGPGTAPRRVRKARITRARVCREDIFFLGRVGEVCALLHDRCLVFHNGRPWTRQDHAFRVLASGDWLEIHVPPRVPSPTGDLCRDAMMLRSSENDPSTEGDLDDESDWVSDTANGTGPADPANGGVRDLPEQDIVFCVWAISHSTARFCNAPRVVAASIWPDSWMRQFVDAWQDVLQVNAPTSVHLIVPQPANAQLPDGRRCLHVLLEQGLTQARRAALVTVTVRIGPRNTGEVAAHSLPAYVSGSIIASAVGIDQQDIDRNDVVARLQHRFVPWADIQPASAGANYRLDVRRRPATVDQHADVQSLMQTNLPDVPEDPEPVIPNVLTPPDGFAPEPVALCMSDVLHALPEMASFPLPPSLHELLFQWTAYAWTEALQEGPVMYASVWYIHHIETPSCLIHRTARLGSDFQQWVPQLLNSWSDHFQWREPFRLHVVRPTPPASQLQSHVVHIVIEQGLQSPCAAIVCCRLAAEVLHPGCESVFASSVPRVMSHFELAQLVYPNALSSSLQNPSVCQLIVRARQLELNEDVRLVSGDLVFARNLHGPPQIVHAIDSSLPVHGGLERMLDLSMQPTFHFAMPIVQVARAFDAHQITSEWHGSTLRIRTWFLDHLRLPEFPVYRQVTLSQPWLTWHQQIVSVWQDLVDPQIPVEFSVVRPVPVVLPDDDAWVDLIVWQRPLPQRVAALATVDGRRFAISLPSCNVSPPALHCVDVHRPGTVPMPRVAEESDDMQLLQLGGSRDDDLSDYQCMMQRPKTSWSGFAPPEPPAPSGPPLDHLPHGAFMHFLHSHIVRYVDSNDEGSLISFFLSPVRFPISSQPRVTTVNANAFDWVDRLRATWSDCIDENGPVAFYLVYPTPLDAVPPSTCAYVLLVQDERDDMRAVLFAHLQLTAMVTYQAACVPLQFDREHAIVLAGMRAPCNPPDASVRCEVSHARFLLQDGQMWVARNGQSFLLTFQRQPDGPEAVRACITAAPGSSTDPNDDPDHHGGSGTGSKTVLDLASLVSEATPVSGSLNVLDEGSSVRDAQLPARVVLCLDELISETSCSPPADPVAEVLVDAPDVFRATHILLEPRMTLRCDLPMPDLLEKPLAQALLDLGVALDSDRFVMIRVHTDGSSLWNVSRSCKTSAWAFVVEGVLADGSCKFLGYDTGRVAGNSEDFLNGLLPPDGCPDAYAAEVEALYRALLWVLQCPDFQSNIPFELHADAQSALYSTRGAWSAKQRTFVHDRLRPLLCAARALGTVELYWERGHSGLLWNELADHVAKSTARSANSAPVSDPLQDVPSLSLQWIWYAWPLAVQTLMIGLNSRPSNATL